MMEHNAPKDDKKALPQEELTTDEIRDQLIGGLYRITVQLLKEEPVPANLDKIEQIRRNIDTIVRLMDYLT